MIDKHFNFDNKFRELYMYHCGIEECKPAHSYGPAVRDHFLIHYILDGEGTFHVNGKIYSLTRDQGFLICPDFVTYYEAHTANPWHYIWVGFHGQKAEEYLKNAGLNQQNPVFTYRRGSFLKDCMMEMIKADENYNKGKDLRLQSLLYHFLSELMENGDHPGKFDTSRNVQDSYIHKAIQYINMNYSFNISISTISRQIGLDRSYLCHLFKQRLGVSPSTFLIQYRVNKACELMTDSRLTIGDISRSVGYEDPLVFSKAFKRLTGLSPNNYRKNMQP